MSEWAPRRFWTTATADPVAEGWQIALDGRTVRTPAKAPLIVPSAGLAQAIVSEWDAQGEKVDPESMPFTRSANSAIDRVAPGRAEVARMVAAYGETDLLCYRADAPAELATLQAARWDPLLDWAHETYGARLLPAVGVMFTAQDDAALARLAGPVEAADPFRLTALHDLVALSGSLVLGLAVAEGRLDPEAAWALSRLDEDWQAEQWGRDDEAEAAAAFKHGSFLHADRLYRLIGA